MQDGHKELKQTLRRLIKAELRCKYPKIYLSGIIKDKKKQNDTCLWASAYIIKNNNPIKLWLPNEMELWKEDNHYYWYKNFKASGLSLDLLEGSSKIIDHIGSVIDVKKLGNCCKGIWL